MQLVAYQGKVVMLSSASSQLPCFGLFDLVLYLLVLVSHSVINLPSSKMQCEHGGIGDVDYIAMG